MNPEYHIVGVVGNDITMDSRIRKVAATAAAAGYRATILCFTASGAQRTTEMGGVEVIRVPVTFNAHNKNGRVPNPLRPFAGNELAARHIGPRTHELARRRRLEAEEKEIDPRSLHGAAVRFHLFRVKAMMRLRHDVFRLRRRGHVTWDKIVRKFNLTRVRATLRFFRPFRDGVPNIADYEVTFGPILEDLKPDLIHAHDYHMIGLTVTAARNLKGAGTDTKVVYDAHELVEGLSYPRPTIDGWLKLEEDFIDDVDAVTGVSPEQLDRIQERYGLGEAPTLVMNAPVVRGRIIGDSDVRKDSGIDGPILVYHGNVVKERGLDTLIEALEHLPSDVEVAVLAPSEHPAVEAVVDLAASLGVGDRLHVLGYVSGEQLPEYLSTADVEVIPYLLTGNNDIALPNKLFEAIQAGLPILTSDMRSMTRFVSDRGIGEVFEAGSAQDLAKKAQAILADPDKYRSHITAEAKEEASWDAQADRLLSVYSGLLGTSLPPRADIDVASVSEGPHADQHVEARPPKQAIGPRNMAGQAYMIAAAVQSELGVPAVSFSIEHGYEFGVHQRIHEVQWRDPAWQHAQRRVLAEGFTHVIAESGTGMLGSLNGGFIDEQLPELTGDGLDVAVLLHGSEIRDPRRHRELPYSPYAVTDDLTRSMEKATARLRRHLNGMEVPIFVTTPDLLEDVDATWLPVVIDTKTWESLDEPFGGETPTILHLPSNSRLKGSEHVDPLLRELEDQGRVKYIRPDGRVSASEVSPLIEQADIIVDQLVVGAYGVMSCQAMAAGRITIANTRDIGSLAAECPIINADPGTLRNVLHDLLNSREQWQQRSAAGHRFVTRYHNGAYAAETLKPFLNLD